MVRLPTSVVLIKLRRGFGDGASRSSACSPRRRSTGDRELMYCPTCSTQAVEGAKFCKTCGMNLNVVTQALNGEAIVTDPLREREFKRARKQISDGIHGVAVGAALLVAAGLPYILNKAVSLPLNSYITALALALALAGIIKLFRSIGSII